jgi:predicted CXXCH cytochrome family protein
VSRRAHQNILAPLVLLSLLWTSTSYSIDFSDCSHCHKAKPRLSGQYIHSPMQTGCRVCHAEAHKQGAKDRLGLSLDLPQLCFTCHEDKNFRGNVVHPPVGTGKCTVCHDPHSSDSPHLLRMTIPTLCYYTCHKQLDKKVVVHWPVAANGCPLCHKPHASENRSLLVKPLNGLCLECHANIPKTSHRYGITGERHPLYLKNDPLNKGKEFTCLSCHAVHGSDWKKLLRYSVKDPLDFQLCNNCHHISS